VKHIAKTVSTAPGAATIVAVCGSTQTGDRFVRAAMQSDCDDCRNHPSINIGRVGDVRWDGRGNLGVQSEVGPYEPQPWLHIKTLDEERREREIEIASRETVSPEPPNKTRRKKK
jgi:hypothetical protein